MAAPTVQSVATQTPSSDNSVVIPKPTGLAVGELMLVIMGMVDGGSNPLGVRSDWSNLGGTLNAITSANANNVWVGCQYKIADASDVAAGSFTWTNAGGASTTNDGIIYRITGFNTTTPIASFAGASVANSASPSFSNSVTPSFLDSLIIFGGHATQATSSATTASYAIVTDNPTWTERMDSSSSTVAWFSASATRSSTNATGNSSCVIGSDGTTDSTAFLIIVNPAGYTFSVTESLALIETTSSSRTRLFTTIETLSLSETILALKGISFSIAEALSLTETIASLRTRLFTVADSLGLVEIMARIKTLWTATDKNDVDATSTTKHDSEWTARPKS